MQCRSREDLYPVHDEQASFDHLLDDEDDTDDQDDDEDYE
jgi:hypothetical protein